MQTRLGTSIQSVNVFFVLTPWGQGRGLWSKKRTQLQVVFGTWKTVSSISVVPN